MNCLLIIIAVILLIFGIFICTKCDSNKGYFVFGPIFVVLSVLALFMSIMIAGVKDDFNTFSRKYNETKYMIETYTPEKDENLNMLYSIIGRTKTLNSDILANRKYHDNVFIGFMYNECIGNFELIEVDTTKLKIK